MLFVIRERLGNVFSMGLKSCWMFLRVVDTWVALRKKCGGKKKPNVFTSQSSRPGPKVRSHRYSHDLSFEYYLRRKYK